MPGQDEIDACLAVLARLEDADLDAGERLRLERGVTAAARGIKRRAKLRRASASRAADRELLGGAVRFHTEIPDVAPAAVSALSAAGPAGLGMLRRERRCYVCKAAYREVDADYHMMCGGCAEQNRAWRTARADLTGRTAIVTGGRVKIGFHTALKLLRDGAEVLVTTRFPRDAARRFAAVPDVGDWAGRLRVHGLDLLDLPALQAFVAEAGRRTGSLDILVNNAAQTLFRPAAYHREVRAAEAEPLAGVAARLDVRAAPQLGSGSGARLGAFAGVTPGARDGSALLPAGFAEEFFPAGFADETGEQLDLRRANSWTMRDGDVSPHEWLQVHVVNAFAPFLLTSRLRPLLARGGDAPPWRHVVQVSAMEGSFSRLGKTVRHPHTNMAKASLNMMVRTVAADYVRDGVLMNAVDTGWVTDERPHPHKQHERAGGFRPPLDVVDGAARVYHPIVAAERGEPVGGVFLKDYRSVPW